MTENEIKNKEWEKERSNWYKFYTTFNDDNMRHADQAFQNNGLLGATKIQLMFHNISWFIEVMDHGYTAEQICTEMPEASTYKEAALAIRKIR